jgi:hypothetical protein
MASMTLIERIDQGIEGTLNYERFERAAMALLRPIYPWISPVEAGTDFGRDADIYRVSDEPQGFRGRVLATTGDPLANLKRSHKSWAKQGEAFHVDSIVIACARNVTATERKRLELYCDENQLPPPEIYGRSWLRDALVDSAEWREYLIGVRGRLDAVRPMPVSDGPVLVGRIKLLQQVRTQAGETGDVVIVGEPGVGKSRLVAEIGGSIHLVEPAASEYLLDDIRLLQPKIMFLDDAHLHQDTLAGLTLLRSQEGLDFSLWAATWPDEASAVRSNLSDPGTIVVDRMRRADIDAVVQNLGVTSVRGRHLVLDQSDGRPGWAEMLCQALLDGSSEDVVTGGFLLGQVERYLRSRTADSLLLDALAVITAIGGATVEDVPAVAREVGLPHVTLVDDLRRVATRGLIDQRQDRWSLHPTLRAPLVRRWFFGETRMRSWQGLSDAFPQKSAELFSSLVEAAEIDPGGPAANAVERWLDGLPAVSEWDHATLKMAGSAAMINESISAKVAVSARAILATDRPVTVTRWGSRRDALGDESKAILNGSVKRFFVPEAVLGLLDLGLSEAHPQNQGSEHPLRVLREMAHHLDPDYGSLYEVRARLLDFATAWFLGKVGTPEASRVFAEVIRYIFDPEVDGNWSDPAARRTFHMSRGVESASNMAELVALWPRAAATLNNDFAVIEPGAILQLVELFATWLRLAAGHAGSDVEMSDEQKTTANDFVWDLLETLRPLVEGLPGLALKLQKEIDWSKRWNLPRPEDALDLLLNDDVVALLGRRDPFLDTESRRSELTRGQDRLAERIAAQGAEAGLRRWIELLGHAAAAGEQSAPGYFVAWKVAQLAEPVETWLVAALRADEPTIFAALVQESYRRALVIDEHVLLDALSSTRLRGATINASIQATVADRSVTMVIGALGADDVHQLHALHGKAEADEVLRLLLRHDVLEVRASAASAFNMGTDFGPELPIEWQGDWEKAFIESAQLDSSGHDTWRMGELLSSIAVRHPQVAREWFKCRLARIPVDFRSGIGDENKAAMRKLAVSERRILANDLLPDEDLVAPVLRSLICGDASLARHLLADDLCNAEDLLHFGLGSHRNSDAAAIATVLVENDVSPRDIAFALCRGRSWMGSESAAIETDIAWFQNLAENQPAMLDVCEIALDYLNSELHRSRAEEDDEEKNGW